MKRLPFGIKTAAAIFQKTIENILRDIPDGAVYQNDIIVTGKHLADHIRNLKTVLSRLESEGLKYQFKTKYLTYVLPQIGMV